MSHGVRTPRMSIATDAFRLECLDRIPGIASAELDDAIANAGSIVKTYATLSDARRFVCVDMVVSLTPRGFEQFFGMLERIDAADFIGAAAALRASSWYQVEGEHGRNNATILETGEWYPVEAPALSAQSAGTHVISATLAQAAAITPANYVSIRKGLLDGDTTLSDLDGAFADYAAGPYSRMTLFFHGGLVDKASGISNAQRLAGPYLAASAYPLFFVWQSGLGDVIRNRLPEIAQETILHRIITLVSWFIQSRTQPLGQISPQNVGSDFLPAPAEAYVAASNVDPKLVREMPPPSDAELAAFAQRVRSDTIVARELRVIAQTANPDPIVAQALGAETPSLRASGHTLMSPSVVAGITGSIAEADAFRAYGLGDLNLPFSAAFDFGAAVAGIAYRVTTRFRAERDHGMQCTVVEEILRTLYAANAGYAVWKSMKDDTARAFGPDGAGTAVAERVAKLAREGHKSGLTLIGHSAGSIYVCNLLRAMDRMLGDLPLTFDVVLIAPAVTVQLFAATVQDVGRRIGAIRVFALHDALECADAILGRVYPRSLLYLVSGVCEDEVDQPLVGMERYFTGTGVFADRSAFPDIAGVAAYLGARTVLAKTGPAAIGFESDAEHHGPFPHEARTLASTQSILKSGLQP